MMISEQNDEECPSFPQGELATDDDSSTTAGYIILSKC
jgi:hypothetical protein